MKDTSDEVVIRMGKLEDSIAEVSKTLTRTRAENDLLRQALKDRGVDVGDILAEWLLTRRDE